NNVFCYTPRASILIAGDCKSWFESGAVKDILIENNTFIKCQPISIHPENKKVDPMAPVHKNIRVVSNIFDQDDPSLTTVEAKSTQGIEILGNTLKMVKKPSDIDSSHLIKQSGCSDVKIADNKIVLGVSEAGGLLSKLRGISDEEVSIETVESVESQVNRAQGSFKEKLEQTVVFTYNKPIEDYWITVFWRPHEKVMGYLLGPAIMEFKHKDRCKSFSVTNNNFGVPISSEWFGTVTLDGGYYMGTSQLYATLDYEEPTIVDRMPSTSFFFLDLNFDGDKELVLTEFVYGQRWRNSYKVYEVDGVGRKNSTFLMSEPFDFLDSNSIIDIKNRTITNNLSSGADLSGKLHYKFDKEEGGIV
ncbi:MAG: hypothetical protein HQL32_07185, partial [Planctomycetes bacterium]|nr:hypothetical protein [Planctomycetota bacterium]